MSFLLILEAFNTTHNTIFLFVHSIPSLTIRSKERTRARERTIEKARGATNIGGWLRLEPGATWNGAISWYGLSLRPSPVS